MKCKTCSHPQRQAIDLALLAENHTFEALSREYGLSISSLFRHKKHLADNLRRARRRLEASQAQVSLLKLNAFLDHVQRAVQTAEADGNVDKVLKGSYVGSRIIHQINQMEVPLELDTVYRLLSSPQWVSQDSLLPTDPKIITGIHQALADTAFFPCPDPPQESAEDDEEEAAEIPDTISLETKNLALETQVQQLLAGLSLPAHPQEETTPPNKRQKSAKLPKNSRPSTDNIENIQEVNLCEKNLPKNPGPGRKSAAPPANPAPEAFVADITLPLAAAHTPPKPSCEQWAPANGLLTRLKHAMSPKLPRKVPSTKAMSKPSPRDSQGDEELGKNLFTLPRFLRLANPKAFLQKLRRPGPKIFQPPPVHYQEEYDNIIPLDTGRYRR